MSVAINRAKLGDITPHNESLDPNNTGWGTILSLGSPGLIDGSNGLAGFIAGLLHTVFLHKLQQYPWRDTIMEFIERFLFAYSKTWWSDVLPLLVPKLCCFDKCPGWLMLVSRGPKLIENKLIDIEGSCQLDANRRLNYDKMPSADWVSQPQT